VTAGKDNIVIFVIFLLDGEPCDDNSHLLAKDNKLFAIKDVTLGRAKVIIQECRYLIVVKTKFSTLLKQKAFKEVLRSLYDVTTLELNLQTISVSKTDALGYYREIPARIVLRLAH